MYISEPLHRLIESAKLVACDNGLIGVMFASMFLFVSPETFLLGFLLGAAGATYVLIAIALAVLARFMDRGTTWAFVATWILSIVLLLQVMADVALYIIGFAGPRGLVRQVFCLGVIHLPHLYIAIAAMNSYEPLRDMVRHRRRERLAMQRAFEPIMPPPPPPHMRE